MKKLDLEKKALKYSAVVGSVAAFAGTAESQIVYTDVNPDASLGHLQTYMLDVNNDLTDDFAITQFDTVVTYGYTTFPASGVALLTAGSNGAISSAGQINYLAALTANSPIDNTQLFAQSTSSSPLVAAGYVITFGQGIGPWIDGADHFMGLTFIGGANTYYGWCRMSVATDASGFVIKDYAYNSTVQGGILAGQMVGIAENVENGVAVNIINNEVVINVLNTELTNGTVNVISITGQNVFSGNLNGKQTVDLNGYASGVYMVQITFDQGQFTRKLFVR